MPAFPLAAADFLTFGSEMRELDRIDRKILDILQREGRISITELAEKISLSATPCSERVRRLEREGVITGYHARINPAALGKTLLVFLEIRLSAKSGDVFDKVKQELLYVPEVMECHLVSGDFDYLVKARLSEMNEYRRLLGEILKRLPASAESHSYVVMEEIKETLYLPVDR
ncbi:winged helix-turn-helix DNA-binding protein [Bordetella bronchiseptica SBL-F6116]|nr:leucine responsive regulatory protein [Bordetella bronchiseptica 00-P-2730]KDE00073.1 winged helix-turn-helix DNA-binding protein [Bordetella bronchiseptica SBL-F6116]